MPATYAHYRFGEEVLKGLDSESRNFIAKNRNLYNIGLHGPDILFFYRPYSYNYVNKHGNNLHKKSGYDFFTRASKRLEQSKDFDAAYAYLLGFICHYMLDSECHPYVNKKVKISRIPHNEIETEFERHLMNRDHMNPIYYKPTNHLKIDKSKADCIACFYPGISSEKVIDSIKSMKFFVNIFNSPRLIKGDAMHLIIKSIGQTNLSGLFMTRKENPACLDSNLALEKLYQKSITPTVKAVQFFYRNRDNQGQLNQYEFAELNERFKRNFA